ncbi:MAG: carbohydrate porin [Betaproteobacteria bacterium]|nr:carbohydrate porin [Betaproteobacteria bacterium]
MFLYNNLFVRICLKAVVFLLCCSGVVSVYAAPLSDTMAVASSVQNAGLENAVQTNLSWAGYGQYTNTYQWHPAFTSPYSGVNSLYSGNSGDQTNDATLYLGCRFSPGMEFWVNPEYDQGFGLSNTLGVAGFPSGEAYKAGMDNPYYRLQRMFFRDTINLGGAEEETDAQINQMAGKHTHNNVVLTIGKFSVVDVFDTNSYSHDPRTDFLNWSIIDGGAFDYAADAWGYSYGASVEWTQDWWTFRGGVFDFSTVPNSEKLTQNLSQYQLVTEMELRDHWRGFPGKLKVLAFLNHTRMGSYSQATQLAAQTGSIPNTALVREMNWRPGVELNLEQALGEGLGVFGRFSANDGALETYDTEINQSVSTGFSLQGEQWGRSQDKIGVALAVNRLSHAARDYFAAGGMGLLIGDGQLPYYANEAITEMYYSWAINMHLDMSIDYQHIANPAYNPQRGPVEVFGVRTHVMF